MPGDIAFDSGTSYWGANLTVAVLNGTIPQWRVDDMATRIMVRSFEAHMVEWIAHTPRLPSTTSDDPTSLQRSTSTHGHLTHTATASTSPRLGTRSSTSTSMFRAITLLRSAIWLLGVPFFSRTLLIPFPSLALRNSPE